FGQRANGLTYGWSADNIANTRDRNTLADQRYDTFNHMQKGGDFTWEYALPNGTYTVRVVAGESDFFDSTFRINVEGTLAVSGSATSGNRFVEGTVTVTVSDGRLTISNGAGAINNKIAFVEIIPSGAPARRPKAARTATSASPAPAAPPPR
ncbi:MAG TPA: hypothetical protein PKB10_00930, partial [Tepidisphaeraceae bacterium]|nr:hypothetical protein [Tepidisphaeraceae bacterium]